MIPWIGCLVVPYWMIYVVLARNRTAMVVVGTLWTFWPLFAFASPLSMVGIMTGVLPTVSAAIAAAVVAAGAMAVGSLWLVLL